MASELLPFCLGWALTCRSHETTWSWVFVVFSHLWGKAFSQEEGSWWKAHCLGHNCQCLGSRDLQGAVCGKQLRAVIVTDRFSQLWNGCKQPIRGSKLQPFRGAPHIPALTCWWKSCSHEGHEKHGEVSLGTWDWRHAEREAAEDMAGDTFLEGGTPWWRGTFQGLQSRTAHSREQAFLRYCSRDILESLHYWVTRVRLTTPFKVRIPLRVAAMADPCWGRGKPSTSEEKQTETIKHTTQSLLGHTFPHLRN